ncbi:unnamed protein product, partial [Didymodactylos carnosus]
MAVIQQLFKYIEVDFRRNYPHLGTKAAGFQHWWINRNGDLMGITKCIDMYIYLCDSKHYPLSINNIQLKPILPKHLPVQLSVLIKFVDNYISVDEVKTELEGQFTKIFAIVDIFGSKNMRNRHVRMDLASKSEYENILNSSKVSIFGQLYDAYEFLSPQKFLICSKCNSPGHTKKNCICDIEVCRRCGSDRLNGDHINCIIKCHHCEGAHLSTNYVCPILTQYRKDLVAELKRRPDLIPEDVQLFIPGEYRVNDKNNRILGNNNNNNLKQQKLQEYNNYTNINPWMSGNSALTIPTYKQHQEFSLKMKLINDELEEIKREHAKDKISFKRRYDNQLKKTNEEIDILKTQIKIQNEMVKDMYTAVIEIVPAIHQTIIALGRVIEMDNSDNDNESIQLNYNKILHELSKTSEMVLDRTDLLQKHHEKLMGV